MKNTILNYINKNSFEKKYLENTILNISKSFQIPKNTCAIVLNKLLEEDKIQLFKEILQKLATGNIM